MKTTIRTPFCVFVTTPHNRYHHHNADDDDDGDVLRCRDKINRFSTLFYLQILAFLSRFPAAVSGGGPAPRKWQVENASKATAAKEVGKGEGKIGSSQHQEADFLLPTIRAREMAGLRLILEMSFKNL